MFVDHGGRFSPRAEAVLNETHDIIHCVHLSVKQQRKFFIAMGTEIFYKSMYYWRSRSISEIPVPHDQAYFSKRGINMKRYNEYYWFLYTCIHIGILNCRQWRTASVLILKGQRSEVKVLVFKTQIKKFIKALFYFTYTCICILITILNFFINSLTQQHSNIRVKSYTMTNFLKFM